MEKWENCKTVKIVSAAGWRVDENCEMMSAAGWRVGSITWWILYIM